MNTTPETSTSNLFANVYRAAILLLLTGILILQWSILNNTQVLPTYGDYRNASGEEAQVETALLAPLVRVQDGRLRITGTVKLDEESIARIRAGQ